jgi:hypothetical protein
MSLDLSEAQIQKILEAYKNKREREKERYEQIKDTEEFKIYNRNKAKLHYENNKEMYKEKYKNKKELMKAKNSYYYYKRKNDMEAFQKKYPDRYELLLVGGYFNDWKPLEST